MVTSADPEVKELLLVGESPSSSNSRGGAP